MTLHNRSTFSSLLFYTHNVARALKPSVDGELAHAIHETLHFALDGEPQDFTNARSNKQSPCGNNEDQGQASTSTLPSNSAADGEDEYIRPGFFATNDEERPYISFAWEQENGTLILPHPKTVDNPTLSDPCTSIEQGSGVREAFDVTAKFFYLGKGTHELYPQEWVYEAMKRFSTATGLDSVETLILSFAPISEFAQALDDRIDAIATLWKKLSPSQNVQSMGLSDFSEKTLETFLNKLKLGACESLTPAVPATDLKVPKSSITSQVQESLASNGNGTFDPLSQTHIHIPSSPSKVAFNELSKEGDSSWHEYGPSNCRRPRLCTINLKEQTANGNISAAAPTKENFNGSSSESDSVKSLASYCKDNNMLLVAHSDRKGEQRK